ncbi:MAG: ComEC/Rec2 family competence protein [Planctomycetota bacterium]
MSNSPQSASTFDMARHKGIAARGPLPWFVIAITVGVVVDRIAAVPLAFSLALAVASLMARLIVRATPAQQAGFFLLAAAAAGAAYHNVRQHDVDLERLANLASSEGTPIRVRGRLAAPLQHVPGSDDPLQTILRPDANRLVIDVHSVLGAGGVEPLRGRVVAYVAAKVESLYVGDEIEAQGRLVSPAGPSNPGEFDGARELRDQGVAAILSVPPTVDALRLVARRWPGSILGWLGRLHAACRATLDERLTAEPGLAAALLLGDGSGLGRPEWDKFLRSGVVHALAISGQHLIVLAGFFAVIRRMLFIRLTPATLVIAAILVAYALLTGGRAPAMRAAWVVLAFALAVIVKRPAAASNAFALAWLGVVLVNPADVFQTGCQLSFLAVAILHWVITPWMKYPVDEDPLAKLERTSETALRRNARRIWDAVWLTYLASAIIWLSVTPLVAARYHVVSPIALLIGPPVGIATSIALVSGFLLLLSAPLIGPLAAPLAWVTDGALWACETMIDWGLAIPGASFTVCDLPPFWLAAFYVGMALALLWRPAPSRWLLAGAAAWLVFGLCLGLGLFRRPEFHLAFLSVGHGGCTVMETAGGRVLVYDAGAMAGPDVARRIVIPYLWSRGIRRIDDLFISHADLDHFNGVSDLARKLTIGRITLTPSFASRRTPAVRQVIADLASLGIPTRVFQAGDAEEIDDIKLDVLHPPAIGPEGKENARSLVMRVGKQRFAWLLTGDLEDAGLEQTLAQRPPGIDILTAPHHGSRAANTPSLAAWARPRVVISSQGRPRGLASPAPVYEAIGAQYLTTFREGALEVRAVADSLEIATFRTQQVIRLGPPPVR